jgi:hypothetical protein
VFSKSGRFPDGMDGRLFGFIFVVRIVVSGCKYKKASFEHRTGSSGALRSGMVLVLALYSSIEITEFYFPCRFAPHISKRTENGF